MRLHSVHLLGAAALALAGSAAPVAAAVRICKASVASGPQVAASIAVGQKRAITAWVEMAKIVGGDRHTSWRLASTKSLTCAPAAGSGVVCEARGQPCVIEQTSPKAGVPDRSRAPEPKVIPVPSAPVGAKQIKA